MILLAFFLTFFGLYLSAEQRVSRLESDVALRDTLIQLQHDLIGTQDALIYRLKAINVIYQRSTCEGELL